MNGPGIPLAIRNAPLRCQGCREQQLAKPIRIDIDQQRPGICRHGQWNTAVQPCLAQARSNFLSQVRVATSALKQAPADFVHDIVLELDGVLVGIFRLHLKTIGVLDRQPEIADRTCPIARGEGGLAGQVN